MFDSPLVFFYNTLIIFATLVIATLFRRRVFFLTVVTIIWMAIGITNGIILIERMTPFTVKDLSAITDGATIITNYFFDDGDCAHRRGNFSRYNRIDSPVD